MHMLYERVIQALLTEAKIDSFARMINQKMMRAVKKSMDKVNKQGGIKMQYTQSWPDFMKRKDYFGSPEGREKRSLAMTGKFDATAPVTFKVELIIQLARGNDRNYVDVGGAWSPIHDTLRIEIIVQSTTGIITNQHLSMIQARGYEVVRHELEHSVQPDEYLVPAILANQQLQSEPKGPFSSPKAIERYFTSQAEIEAFVTGLYHKAKRTRQPFVKIVEDQIQKFFNAGLRHGVDAVDMRNVMMTVRYKWLEYAKKRYPNAVVQ